MNEQILKNLYEFWELVGTVNRRFSKTENYSTVTMSDSDWPNRIYNLKKKQTILDEVIPLFQKGKVPGIITVEKPNNFAQNDCIEFVFGQKNMALDLNTYTNVGLENSNVVRVQTDRDAVDFAKTASASFGYRVDSKVIATLLTQTKSIRLFVYKEEDVCLGCGIVFFDSNNNAGLHMIGTLPEGRGKGIGRSVTERLLREAKENNSKSCVLHASLMGEPIYAKLGFRSYGEIETYRITKES